MAKHYKLTMVALSVLSTLAYAEETLEQINIEYTTPPKQEVFKKGDAISVRDNISSSTQAIDDIIRSVPGAFTNLDKSSGAISVNLRGQTGLGRVDTMIDGVSQTFFATSGDNSKKSGGTSQFGALIDPAFIASVDIHRGSGGKNGSTALIGSANFRTIGVDDVLTEGKNIGVMINGGGGTNSTGPNYMVALAGKRQLSDTASIGAMYAYSWRKTSQDFNVGGGVNIRDVDKEDVKILATKSCAGQTTFEKNKCIEEAIERYERQPYDPTQLTQHPKSHLAKLEFKNEKHQAILAFRSFSSALSGRNLDNRNYQFNYTYTPKENLSFNVILADNTAKQTYHKGAFYNNKELTDVLISKNKSNTLNLNVNFRTPPSKKWSYEFTLGSNFLINKYSKNRHPRELAYNFAHGEPASVEDCPTRPYRSNRYDDDGESKGWLVCDYHSTKSNTFQPDGKQRFKTFYLDQTFKYDIYTLRVNLNRQFYKYSGTTFHRNKFHPDSWKKINEKYKGLDVWTNSTSEDFVNRYGVENLVENHINHCYATPYAAKGYVDINCPSRQEYELKKGGSRTHTNYSVSLSADFHPLFSPFITYSKTHRVPNIKEMYFSEIGDLAVRTDLKSEKAKTIQFGINGHKEGIFSDYDMLGFKILAYQTKIHDYILNAKRECNGYNIDDCYPHITHFNYTGGVTKYIERTNTGASSSGTSAHYKPTDFKEKSRLVPLDGVVTLKGIELEVNYDIGWFYANLAYARQKSNQPSSFSDSSAQVSAISSSGQYLQGFGLSKVSVLPKDYASLDIGTRLFDGKLTLGAVAKYYGKFKRAQLDKSDGDVIVSDVYKPKGMKVNGWMRISGTEEIKAQPMIFDFYAVFQPTENLTIKGEIQNAFDKKYINPLDANNDSASQSEFIMGEDLGQMTALNNYSRGRTFVLNVNYRF